MKWVPRCCRAAHYHHYHRRRRWGQACGFFEADNAPPGLENDAGGTLGTHLKGETASLARAGSSNRSSSRRRAVICCAAAAPDSRAVHHSHHPLEVLLVDAPVVLLRTPPSEVHMAPRLGDGMPVVRDECRLVRSFSAAPARQRFLNRRWSSLPPSVRWYATCIAPRPGFSGSRFRGRSGWGSPTSMVDKFDDGRDSDDEEEEEEDEDEDKLSDAFRDSSSGGIVLAVRAADIVGDEWILEPSGRREHVRQRNRPPRATARSTCHRTTFMLFNALR